MIQSNRLRLYTLAGSAGKIDMKKYKIKKYTHFDNKISIDKVINDIINPNWVSSHGFYPFIHFQMESFKYNKLERTKKPKYRDIYYASHIDSYIYKYYGDMLNNSYNILANKLGINEVVTSYRNNFKGKSNINFAKEVIDFIKNHESAFIYVADFTKFFDRLDHKYLKDMLRRILCKSKLPDDYYAVFKNITRFSWVDKTCIESVLKRKYKTKDRIKKLTKFRYFDEKEFRRFRQTSDKYVKSNKNDYGIPQGAGISSVYSNIYLVDFDKKLNDYIESNNGIYRRYCDDLIIVIPFDEYAKNLDYDVHINFFDEIINETPNLEVQKEKTGIFIYNNNEIYNECLEPSQLDYLGFTFDGHNVRIRERSMFKFYSRAYKKIRFCNKKTSEHGRIKHRKELYTNYSHLGKVKKGYGNFLSYASRAQRIFDIDSKTNNMMEYQVKNHWKYINQRLQSPVNKSSEI